MVGLLSNHNINKRDWFDRSGGSTGWYDRFTDPAAAWHADELVICWESGTDSPGRQVKVKRWSPAGGWSASVTTPFICLNNDSHGVPSQIKLSNGHYVIAGGAHNSNMRLMTSDSPNDITAWTNQTSIAGSNLTYPHMAELNGDMHLRARGWTDGASHQRYGSFYVFGVDGGTLTLSGSARIVDTGNGTRFYGGPQRVVGSEIWCAATYSDINDTFRRDVFFFRYDPVAGTLKTLDGATTVSSFPAAIRNDFRIVDQTTAGVDGNAPDWCFDAAGDMHILYIETIGGGNWELKHRVWDGSTLSAAKDTGLLTDSRTTYCITPWGDNVAAFIAHSDDFALFGDTIMAVYNGTTWGSNILVRAHSGQFGYGAQSGIKDSPAQARMVFCDRAQTEEGESGKLRLFVYGENGFVRAPST